MCIPKNYRSLLFAAVLVGSGSLAMAARELPVLGYKFVRNGDSLNSIHIVPAKIKHLFEIRDSSDLRVQLLLELNRDATETGWGCQDKIIDIISSETYDTLKPIVVAQDEITPAILNCIYK